MPAASGTKRVKVPKVFQDSYSATTATVNLRVRNTSIYRPIVYGSIAMPFRPDNRPATLPPDHTHKWTVMVKGPNDCDITHFVKKVQFKLHETYANPVRTIEHPPFEVSETGWGEFEIQIKIFFVPEANEKPCTLFHFLTLHPYGPDAEQQRAQYSPVRSFTYDELIFPEPTEAMYNTLTTKGSVLLPNNKISDAEPFSREVETQELDKLSLKIQEVQRILNGKKEGISAKEKELSALKEERMKLEKARQQQEE